MEYSKEREQIFKNPHTNIINIRKCMIKKKKVKKIFGVACGWNIQKKEKKI